MRATISPARLAAAPYTARSPTQGALAAIHPDLDGAAKDKELTPIIPMLRSNNEDSNPGPDNAGDVPDGPENHCSEPTPDETPLQQEAMSVEQLADELGLDVSQIKRFRQVAAVRRVRDSQGRIDDDVAGEAAGNVSVVRAREAPPSEPQEGTHKSRIKAELLKPSNAFLSLTSTNSPHLFLLVLDRTFLNTPKPSPQTCFQPAQSGNYYRKLSRFTSRESFRNSCYFNLATVDEWTYEGCVGSPNPGRIITKGQPKNVHVAKYWTHWNKPGEDSGYKVVIGWDNPNDGSTRAYQCPWYKASDHNSVIVGCSDCLKHDFTEQPPPA
ncbi:hypothetical protein PtA15_2A321 [Puccinia triticina]|uniref:Uncharacterized protein n=1 Tax=Puccinia triticina TaxID=208348 RepID=A0ABY7CAQ2_9BASI|nr:uncharacterized protein PtA15_2A321 [Puccinia triticina]WAQ82008.1 hypothetical protein PtA15_2A321 [Puccinia triticina]